MPDRTADSGTDADSVGGRYRLLEEVGRGGMATVHRAHDDVLDRDVAVKVLHGHLADDPAFLDRFRREARSAAALTHPNVVAVHDWGESDDSAFLVLHLVQGASLRDLLLDRGHLAPREAAAVVLPIARGLAAAHRAGLVHRDVKPENVLLDADGTVRITDFGLARAAASATTTFGDGVLVGSPHYIAPEAVRGEPLGAPADVYSLGILLYEALVGAPPHEGESPYATALAHTTTPVPQPSAAREEITEALDEVVRRATAVEPGERYADAGAFADALEAAQPDASAAVVPLPAEIASGSAGGGTRRRDTAVVEAGPTTRITASDASPGRVRRAVGVLALLVVLGATGYLIWDQFLAPVTEIPAVEGLEVAAATRQLEEQGFTPLVADERPYDLGVPTEHVLAQSPVGTARQGSEVLLTVSAGPRPVEIPPVVGEPQETATSQLTEAGLEPRVERVHDEEVAEGLVIATAPVTGEVVDEASAVDVTVSSGPRPRAVPGLIGEDLASARELLAERQLELAVTERRYDDAADGVVIAQQPDVGTQLARGEVVGVVVSEGPAPVEVPAVRSEHVDEATAILEARGFAVEVERRGGFSAFLNPGRVYDQDPAPGAMRVPGTVVRLYAYED